MLFCTVHFQIAHMTKSEMGYTDYGHIGPLLLFLNQYFNNFLPEIYVLYIALIWCTYDLLVYCSQVRIKSPSRWQFVVHTRCDSFPF